MTAGIMTKFRIDELSGVDRPAQAGAVVTFMKRDGSANFDPVIKREFSSEQRGQLASSGAALPDGSFPIETTADLHNAVQAFGRAKDPAKAKAHIISRAKALGAGGDLPQGWTAKADPTPETKPTGGTMDKTLLKSLGLADTATADEVVAALVAKSAADAAANTAALRQVRKDAMSDAEKAYCAKLSDNDADDFMSKSKDDREKMMTKAAEGDETFTSEGVTISKRAVGEGVFQLLKAQAGRLADQSAEIAKANERAANAVFEKRATEELPYVTGTVAERAAMLKGIESMTDPVAKAASLAALKAANSVAKNAFAFSGRGGGVEQTDDAAAQLEKKAKDYEKAHPGTSFAKAYDTVAMAEPDLYEKAKEQQKERARAAN